MATLSLPGFTPLPSRSQRLRMPQHPRLLRHPWLLRQPWLFLRGQMGEPVDPRKNARKTMRGTSLSGAGGTGEPRGPRLSADWLDLRAAVAAADYELNAAIYQRIKQIFLDQYATNETTPAGLTREYNQEEFLAVLDQAGRPTHIPPELLADYQRALAAHPAFSRWFQPGILPASEAAGQPVLLAARWLCHLCGLRHGTVEIFIDPPGTALAGHTLVQIRGLEKFEAPGAFDIPCAGHISATDPVELALRKELGEELNLTLDDFEELRLLGRYNSYKRNERSDVLNHEHRVLYRARLKTEAAAHIRFTDGEVAGLAVFAVEALQLLVQRYPERVASGLSDAIGYYL